MFCLQVPTPPLCPPLCPVHLRRQERVARNTQWLWEALECRGLVFLSQFRALGCLSWFAEREVVSEDELGWQGSRDVGSPPSQAGTRHIQEVHSPTPSSDCTPHFPFSGTNCWAGGKQEGGAGCGLCGTAGLPWAPPSQKVMGRALCRRDHLCPQ